MFKKIALFFIGVALMASQAFAVVEVNTADQAALDSITGVGPATSKAMLDERKKAGNFKDWADLAKAHGLQVIEDYLKSYQTLLIFYIQN
jgi:competence protein ComEA